MTAIDRDQAPVPAPTNNDDCGDATMSHAEKTAEGWPYCLYCGKTLAPPAPVPAPRENESPDVSPVPQTPEETFIEGSTGAVVLYGMTTQDAIERLRKENRPMDVYHRFIEEVDALTIKADWGAVKVAGELTRAVKRAQLVHDGELKPVSER